VVSRQEDYRQRQKVERSFARLSNFRRLLIRWECIFSIYRSWSMVAVLLLWLRRLRCVTSMACVKSQSSHVREGMLAMQKRTPSIPFPWAWWAFDLGDARPCDATYCQYPYEDLPPIPTLDRTLSWLGQPGWLESPDVTPERRASRERLSAVARDKVRDLTTQAGRLGLMLPNAFTRLMAAPDLYTRIPKLDFL
jgi:hypothetical protein